MARIQFVRTGLLATGERSFTSQPVDEGVLTTLLQHASFLSTSPPTFDPHRLCTGYESPRHVVLELDEHEAARHGRDVGHFILDLAPEKVMDLLENSTPAR